MSSAFEAKSSRADEYDMMHELNMHDSMRFSSNSYEVVHKDFYNDFGDLFKPMAEEMKLKNPNPPNTQSSGNKKK